MTQAIPESGGSYVRQPDGTLKRADESTSAPAQPDANAEKPGRRKDKS